MKTLGSHPGAINFRLSAMVILILLFIYVFLHYTDEAEQAIELQSVEQTRRVIDSALFIVFATYATEGRLDQLADLEGGNPFEFLKEYLAHSIPYRGEIESHEMSGAESGWTLRFSVGIRTMQKVVTVPLSETSTSPTVGTPWVGEAPAEGT